MRLKKRMFIGFLLILLLTGCTSLNPTGAPTFDLLYDVTYTIGDTRPDYLAHISATDAEDGDVSDAIYYDDSDIDYDQAGTYTLTYFVIDSDGNLRQSSITVTVNEPAPIEDTTEPTIYGPTNITYTIDDERPNYLYGITASDDIDGDLTPYITVDDSAVDYEHAGQYPVTYNVTDSSDNEQSVIIYVTVEAVQLTASFNVFYLNDLHGAILPDDNNMGLANIANLIISNKQAYPNETLFIAGGDMLQGALLSNYYQGASVIDMLNLMGLDAFVIGNHEFDWGLDVVLQYFDQNSDADVHANFPLLGANVIEKETGERPEGIDPYTIIEKQGYKIGVIGTIGYGLESSIAAGKVADYMFTDPVEMVAHYATYLRAMEEVDLVFAVNHGDSDYYNNSVADLTGDARVDAIFNGHSHQNHVEQIIRDGMDTFVLQSAAYGQYIGFAHFTFTDGVYAGFNAYNMNQDDHILLETPHAAVQSLIDAYTEEVAELIDTNIITAGEYLSRSGLTEYMAKIMRVKTDSVIAFHNYGGTRTDVSNNQPMTVALVYEIFPFDNVIKTTELLGSTIKSLITNHTDIGYESIYGTIDSDVIAALDDQTYYKVATNDYVYDGNPNTFNSGQHPVDTGILLRDLFIEVLEDLRDAGHEAFYLNLNIPEPLSIDTYIYPLGKETDPFHDIINA